MRIASSILLLASLTGCVAPVGAPFHMSEQAPPPTSRLSPADLAALDAANCDDTVRWTPLAVEPIDAGTRTRERWRRDGCDSDQVVNLLVTELAPGELGMSVLLPGATRATPALQRAATLAVLGRVPEPDCRERWVIDTALTDAPMVEIWTVRACAREHQFRLAFEGEAEPIIELVPRG